MVKPSASIRESVRGAQCSAQVLMSNFKLDGGNYWCPKRLRRCCASRLPEDHKGARLNMTVEVPAEVGEVRLALPKQPFDFIFWCSCCASDHVCE